MPLLNTIGGGSIRSYGRGRGGGAALYPFTDATFTPGGALNKTGPTLTQAITGLTGTGVSAWKYDTNFFNTSSGIQLWTVPVTGSYRIETWGARGSNSGGWANAAGGYGSRMRGDFTLTSGAVIKILVGQTGGDYYGGGGGMTAVATSTNTPLIVSGGGNTISPWGYAVYHAPTTTSGTSGGYSAGGTNGYGGASGNGVWGGAGFFGNPTGTVNSGSVNVSPLSFTNGGTGGYTCNGSGGFGGGSGTDGCWWGASGAGGGYSGGGGGGRGGAGGSYNNGANQSNSAGNTSGAQLSYDGKCIITAI